MSGDKILVTGAAGFLGRVVSGHLDGTGAKVRRMVRRRPTQSETDTVLVPDLLDRRAVRAAVRGTDVVVHLAARAHIMRSSPGAEREFTSANVEGTRIVMEEAAAAGVRKFVFFSSVKAVGEENTAPWTESVVPRPTDPYGVSKFRAEETVRELGERSGVATVILRLPLVYGPGMKGNMLRLFHAVQNSIPLPLLGVGNRRSLVYSANVAEAAGCVIRTAESAGETFFVSDGVDVSTPELLRAIGVTLDKTPLLFPMPRAFLQAAGRFADVLAPVFPVPVGSEMVQRLLGSLTVDISKLRRLTGYRPPFDLQAGLRATGEWYRSSGRPSRCREDQ